MKKEKFTLAQTKALASLLRDDSVTLDRANYPEEAVELADLINEAIKFVEDYKKEHGPVLTERLRDGFIGREIYTDNGEKYYQSTRGRPHGTIVAVKGSDNDIFYGVTYSNEEFDIPVIGQYFALKNAIAEKKGFKTRVFVAGRDKDQVAHFEKRAKAFYWPEKYSVSRGSDPVVYPNYEKIHTIQNRILGRV